MYDVHFSIVIAARIGIISARFIDTKNFRDVNQNCSDLVGQLLSQSIQIYYCHLFIIIWLWVSNLYPTVWFMTFCFTSDLDKTRHNPTYFSQYQRKCYLHCVLPRICKQLFHITLHGFFFKNVSKLCDMLILIFSMNEKTYWFTSNP